MRLRYIFFILIFAGMIVSQTGYAQQISVNARLDTSAVRIGEQIHYTVKITGRGSFNANFPATPDTLTEGIEVLEALEAEKEEDGGLIVLRKQYLVTGFEPGGYAIPPMQVQIERNGNRQVMKTNSAFLQINTVPIDTTQKDIKDVKAPLEAPMTITEFFLRFYPYMLGAILLAALLWYFWVYRKKQAAKPVRPLRKPAEPPHLEAMNALDALDNKMLWQKDKIKAYYTELTDILRHYIYRRFGLPTLERTSPEIMFSLRNRKDIPREYYEQLHYILETSDFVKFARGKTTVDENEQCMQNARNFVRATEPQPEKENAQITNGDQKTTP